MKVYYIEPHQFYPLKDVGKKRTDVEVGELVSFWFPHDDKATTGRVTRVYELNGKTLHDLEKVREHI